MWLHTLRISKERGEEVPGARAEFCEWEQSVLRVYSGGGEREGAKEREGIPGKGHDVHKDRQGRGTRSSPHNAG